MGKAVRERKRVVERYVSPKQQAKRVLQKGPVEDEVKSGAVTREEGEHLQEAGWKKGAGEGRERSERSKIRWYEEEEGRTGTGGKREGD